MKIVHRWIKQTFGTNQLLFLILFALGWFPASPVAGATYTWNGTTTGNWSAAGSWSGSHPASGGTTTDVTDFTGGSGYTSTVDFGVVQQVLQLNFSNTAGTIALTPNSVNDMLTLNGPTSITLNGAGSATISVPLTLATASSFNNTGTGTLTISGADSCFP